MNTLDQVIKDLEGIDHNDKCMYCPFDVEENGKLRCSRGVCVYEDALKQLKLFKIAKDELHDLQEAKPYRIGNRWHCGHCSTAVGRFWEHCQRCGTRILWNGENEQKEENKGEKIMKIYRNVEIETQELQVGDVIRFTLKNGEKAEAMAVEKQEDRTIFCFVDCLKKEYSMNKSNTTIGGYEKSDFRKILNTKILDLFPDEIRGQMKPFTNGDLLKIPSLVEIFGDIESTGNEPEDEKQWEPMKDRRNRIAFQGSKTGTLEWYWLRSVVSGTGFAVVHHNGCATSNSASSSYGIRPAFGI